MTMKNKIKQFVDTRVSMWKSMSKTAKWMSTIFLPLSLVFAAAIFIILGLIASIVFAVSIITGENQFENL